ncbi:hypothetical protein BACUNI_03983 [Bacteroides uniformis ATCC 8492]|uniref:Secreted protein n=1 Tax=Bacteroides uniformis (strain ATCC 8492 / DSM 6597 / CCUG 4942 / CIP 103695 / JCM 5828 / KCTC 5204 / NCTC 13054 / VPI 0061) TaxID=411479 RepID=A0ABC9N6V4_BACUC|nr:hypothetical protein BACUNI_03983 [Bacteroides uniformis ATCC 8492]
MFVFITTNHGLFFLSLRSFRFLFTAVSTTGQQSSGTYQAHRYNLHIHTLVFISFQLTKLKTNRQY